MSVKQPIKRVSGSEREGEPLAGVGCVHQPRRKPNPRARHGGPLLSWLCAVLALGAAARSPAEPSAHLHQISDPATSCIPKGRGLREGNPIAWHPHLSHPRESAAGPIGKFRSAATSGEKAKDVLATSVGTSGDGDLGEELR